MAFLRDILWAPYRPARVWGTHQANLELAFGRSLQRCSPKLLAVSRLFTTASAAEVRGRTADDLGAWDQPLSLINEVWLFFLSTSIISCAIPAYCVHDFAEHGLQCARQGLRWTAWLVCLGA